jgi:CRP-like cAMP-binding protein
MLREHVVRIGRQSAFNRIGHIFLELFYRLKSRGLTNGHGFDFPVTQEMLANALGLTPIHINRTLKKLRQSGLIEMIDGSLTLPDPERLARVTSFDNSYLIHIKFPHAIVEQPDRTRPQSQ